jgi:two-component system, cell cycle response regulator
MGPTAAASAAAEPAPAKGGWRQARKAWALLHADSAQAIALARRVLSRPDADAAARARAQLVLGYSHLYLAKPAQAVETLEAAAQACAASADRPGEIMALAGVARAWWRQGRLRQSHERLLALRDEGLRLLSPDQRCVLLNFLAGSHSTAGDTASAFAHMREALREARRTRAPAFEVPQHCNLAHELLQFGDFEGALQQVDDGLERCSPLANPRLLSALLINRVIALTELGRADEALPAVRQVQAIPTDLQGRGSNVSHFETLAVAALRAGALDLARDLIAAAQAAHHEALADEQHELAQARALLALAEGDAERAHAALQPLQARLLDLDPATGAGDGLTLRVHSSGLQCLSDLQHRLGRPADALHTLRRWQQLEARRRAMSSRARSESLALETELIRLRRQLHEQERRRVQDERTQAELRAINAQLSRKVEEVERLRGALQDQATRDALTGLFNRRHLNDSLPTLYALARRDGRPLSVVLIDLDHFKAVNDGLGHQAGDQVLSAFAEFLQAGCRESDVVCRYGGEEFCVLMSDTPAEAARHKTEHLLQQWTGQTVTHEGRPVAGLSFTAGVCDSMAEVDTAAALLRLADEALLQGKRRGRGQVRHAQPAPLAGMG